MKIGNSDSPQPLATTTLSTSRATVSEAKTDGAAVSAQVEISSAATALLQSSQGINASNADFNADKVAQVSAAIADGSFKPNPEAIADKLIANAQELLNKSTS